MRILMIAERFPPQRGGLAVSSHRIASNLSGRDIEVHVFTMTGDLEPGDLESGRLDGVFIHRLGLFKKFDRTYMVACRAIELLHRRHPFDAIIGMYIVHAGYLAAMQGRMMGVPSLIMARGNDVDRELWRPERVEFLKSAIEWADAVGCVSRELMDKCSKLGGGANVHYTPNSVDTEVFAPGDPDPQLKVSLGIGKGPVVGFAGEMRFKKGLHHFMEAARQVSSSNPGAKFLVVGGVREDDREEYGNILLEEPRLANVVIEVPYIRDRDMLVAHYRIMDVMFLPSLWEGMPNSALEAMACGVPVVAGDAGGLADVVDPPRTGYLFAPGDLEAAIEALKAALSMPGDVLRTMRRKARQRAIDNFSPKQETDKIVSILESIVSDSKPANS